MSDNAAAHDQNFFQGENFNLKIIYHKRFCEKEIEIGCGVLFLSTQNAANSFLPSIERSKEAKESFVKVL